MATIRTAIQIYDGMSPAFRSMNKAMNIVLNSFESIQKASHNAVDTNSIRAAREALADVETTYNSVEEAVKNANAKQQKFNGSIRNGGDIAENLKSKLKGIAATVGAAFGIKKIIGVSDEMTLTTARLNLMNDGMQTTKQLQDLIFKSAQRSRGEYQSTADAVSKMGIMARDAFDSNAELVMFVEQLNKQFTIAGAGPEGVKAAMLQLTQAMSSGVLRGEELNSVFEQAPTIVQTIAEYLDVPIGRIRDMASEGLITSDIVKNAMLNAADETNDKFAEIPMTFSQVGTTIGNTLLQIFNPVISVIGKGAQWIYDNWSTLAPVFWGLAAAVGIYTVALGIQTAVTWVATGAAKTFFLTLLKNPLMWIALVIGVIIGVIYKWVKAVGGIKIAWMIATDKILTAWDWVKIGFFIGVFWILDLWDKLKLGIYSAVVGIQNFMGDMKANVLMILQNMVNGAIGIINDFIGVLNKIPGVSIDTIAEVTFGTNAKLKNEAEKSAREADLQAYSDKIHGGIEARDAAIEQMKFDARNETAMRQAEIDAAKADAAKKAKEDDITAAFENLDNNKYLQDTAGNTGAVADSMEITEEDLKYLRDMAEQEVVNRFTTAEIRIDMTNNNNISSEMDIDGIVTEFEDKLYESMETAAEGVYD